MAAYVPLPDSEEGVGKMPGNRPVDELFEAELPLS